MIPKSSIMICFFVSISHFSDSTELLIFIVEICSIQKDKLQSKSTSKSIDCCYLLIVHIIYTSKQLGFQRTAISLPPYTSWKKSAISPNASCRANELKHSFL